MKTPAWIAIVCLIAALGVFGGYQLSSRNTSHHANTPVEKAASERKILYWHDPMVPGSRFDKPGKSPFMDMELVPVYADEQQEAVVQIDPRVSQNLGVRTAPVERQVLSESLSAVGNVAWDERHVEVVQSRVAGNVIRLFVKAPLQSVKRDQPIAEVFAPDWATAEQEYVALLGSNDAALEPIRSAARDRLQSLGIPPKAIEQLEKTRTPTSSIIIPAPSDGVVTELLVREGAAYAAGSPIVRLASLNTVWVNAEIPEAQVSSVPVGATVKAATRSWPGQTFAGRVIALLPQINEQSRTMTARIEISNPKHDLVPGMFVSLDFTATNSTPTLVVPTEAIIVTGERSVVIVARDAGKFDVAEVTVGRESNGLSEILHGLDEGQTVVLSGQFLIDSEASLKSALNRLGESESAHGNATSTMQEQGAHP